jgi:hypothetical protein
MALTVGFSEVFLMIDEMIMIRISDCNRGFYACAQSVTQFAGKGAPTRWV